MKAWGFVAIAVCLLFLAGVIFAGTVITADEEKPIQDSCSNCNKACSKSNNCGKSTCSARIGKSCGCRI